MKLEKYVFKKNDILIDKYDVGIVLGGSLMIPNRCDKAIELYNNNKINYILLSGGVGYFNRNRKNTEAKLMYDYLLENGISKDKILLEDRSRNTYQNALYCGILLGKKFDLENDKFLLITSESHMKRSYLLFKSLIKDIYLDSCSSKDNFSDKDIFKKNFFGIVKVSKEALLIWYYKFRKII